MTQTVKYQEIAALVNLLEDNEEEVWKPVANRLIDSGTEIIPSLEKTWESTLNNRLQERLENIIQEIQFREVCIELRNWDLLGGTDLLKGAYIIAKMQYPDLKLEMLIKTLTDIKLDIWLDLNDNLTALEKVKIINNILYENNKFSSNLSNYYAPQNYYINQVLETRKGNPVSLGIIYITIAEMLEIPIYGINLPKNFVLAYTDLNSEDRGDSILFYINPFNKGAVLGKREIDYFLDQQKIEPNDTYYYPCSNYDIIIRLIYNLINSYESLGQHDKVQRFNKLLTYIKKE